MGHLSKQFIIGLFLALSCTGFGQADTSSYHQPPGLWLYGTGPWPASGDRHQVEAYSRLHAGSNHVPAGLLNRFLTSEFIDASLKDEAYERLGNNNTLLVDWRNGARWQLNKHNNGRYAGSWWFALENRLDITAQFNDDQYALAMYGNARFEGEELVLMAGPIYTYGSNRLTAGYQQVTHRGNSTGTLSGALSIIQVYDYLGVTDFNARVFTAEQGTFIEVDAKGEWQASDTGQSGLKSFEGMGTALQIGYDRYNVETGWRWGVQAGSGDLIRFDNKAFSMQGQFNDTLQGVDLTDQALSDLSVPTDVEEISELFNVTEQEGPYLPLRVWGSVYGSHDLSAKATVSMRYVYFTGINQHLVQLHWDRRLANEWFALGASAHYDNMRGYNLGIRALAQADRFSFVVATDDLLGWVLPGTFTGVSYHARLGYQF